MATVAAGELQVVNPATLDVVATVPATASEAVQELVTEARLAQEAWGQRPLAARRDLLVSLAEVVLERLDEIADAIVSETAKPRVEAFSSELYPALDSLVWLAGNAPSLLAPERLAARPLPLRHKRAWLLYEPVGVVGLISPSNFPFGIAFAQAAFAVAAGNAVVLKSSELTPLSGALVESLFAAAGAPAGLVRVAQGDGRIGEALVRARGLGKLVFTGSVEAGRAAAAAAGERLVPVTLELGGKDPMVVLDDADLRRAVSGALWASFTNAGQVCTGVERIYVERPLYDRFVERLAQGAAGLRLGTDVGPLIAEERRAAIEELVADAVDRGARVRAGGRVPERPGWFYEPTVLVDVPDDARIARDEIFGPVVTVAPVEDERAAVRAANASRFALGASVWTRDPERAARVARALDAGSVWHNDHSYSFGAAQASWGGRKDSGFGRTHSKHGLYDLTSIKLVDRDSGRLPVLWWYPYDARAADGFRGVLGVLYGASVGAKAGAAWRNRRGLLRLARRYAR